jgi:tetratricopeptide (TPR) repeat protein
VLRSKDLSAALVIPEKNAVAKEKKDFFISYTGKDKDKAEWIAWVLEEDGYAVVIQAWDFHSGSNFVLEKQKASEQCERTVAVLSQAYLQALFTHPEWAAAFRQDPTGAQGKLIPVRVEDVEVQGMLGSIVYIDLVGLEEEAAREKLLDEIGSTVNHERRKPNKKPVFSFIRKRTVKPEFSPISIAFARLRMGSTQELVGRQDALEWLNDKLLSTNGCTCALASLHGMGGMGKTFLSQVFVEKNKEKRYFLPVYLGETSPFDAASMMLQKLGLDASGIDTEEKLRSELHKVYSSGSGIIIIDDVRTQAAEILLPQVAGWSVLITTRDKALARKLCGDSNVGDLNALSPEESLQLMRNVLKNDFRESQIEVYWDLCKHLAFRPYSICLAAGYLLNALDPCPTKLLDRLKASKSQIIDDDLDFKNIDVLLRDCLEQLDRKSSLAVKLVYALAASADQGMPLERFIQWQLSDSGLDTLQLETDLSAARDAGIVLIEKDPDNEGIERRKLRLHADLLRLIREEEQTETVDSLIGYLEELLVKRKYQSSLDRSMHPQLFSLVERYKESSPILTKLYSKFWLHLYKTGELKQAFDLGEFFIIHSQNSENKGNLQISYGNQALILKAWGRLDEAMVLHKKEELICLELGNKDGLQKSYCNQAMILRAWGRLEEAMALLEKQEAICIELSNKDSLQISYGNQALILKAWGRLDEAMVLHKKEELICLELGNKDGLQKSYGNQATILQDWGQLDEAMALHKKQEEICLELGLNPSLKICYTNQIILYLKMNQPDQAFAVREKLIVLEK